MTTASTSTVPEPTPEPTKPSVGMVVFARLTQVGQIIVPGIYTWAVTVVPVASERAHSVWPIITASLAFTFLVAGAFVVKDRPRLGHALGIWGFVLACLITWMITSPALQVDRLDPWRAGAGSIGWILFALGWGTPWRLGQHPEDDPRARLHPKLEPRNPPRLRTALSVAVGTVGALACMLLAWRVTEADRGLLLHGAALACSVAIINAAASVGLAQGKKHTASAPKQRIAFAFPWIMAVSALLVIAVAWLVGR